jgi:hypothetical protein
MSANARPARIGVEDDPVVANWVGVGVIGTCSNTNASSASEVEAPATVVVVEPLPLAVAVVVPDGLVVVVGWIDGVVLLGGTVVVVVDGAVVLVVGAVVVVVVPGVLVVVLLDGRVMVVEGLPRSGVTSDLWCRVVPQREDVHRAQAVSQGVPR